MTIAIAWNRHYGKSEELIVVSDSRLISCGYVDVCQKIFPLARGDCFIAFAGETILAFPIVFQIVSTFANFRKYTDRTEDVTDIVSVVVDVINTFRQAWDDTIDSNVEVENRTTKFIFGGWSWKESRFVLFPIHFDRTVRLFHTYTHRKKIMRLGLKQGSRCMAVGNYGPEFEQLLVAELQRKNATTLDYEPLEVLCRMLLEPKFIDRRAESTFYVDKQPGLIGGSPQIVKVYRHSNVRPVAVKWPLRAGENPITLFGRRLFDHEKTLHAIYDPELRNFTYPLSGIVN